MLDLYNNPRFSDFTVNLKDGREIHLHKSILALKSPMFSELLESGHTHTELPADDHVVELCLRFMYGCPIFAQKTETWVQLVKCARFLMLDDLITLLSKSTFVKNALNDLSPQVLTHFSFEYNLSIRHKIAKYLTKVFDIDKLTAFCAEFNELTKTQFEIFMTDADKYSSLVAALRFSYYGEPDTNVNLQKISLKMLTVMLNLAKGVHRYYLQYIINNMKYTPNDTVQSNKKVLLSDLTTSDEFLEMLSTI